MPRATQAFRSRGEMRALGHDRFAEIVTIEGEAAGEGVMVLNNQQSIVGY